MLNGFVLSGEKDTVTSLAAQLHMDETKLLLLNLEDHPELKIGSFPNPPSPFRGGYSFN